MLEQGGDFNPHLHLMDADGQNDKELIKGRSMMGVYSSDGKRIVYMGAKEGRKEQPHIYTCKVDGSEQKALTEGEEVFEVAPRWSADGKRIYFNRMTGRGPPEKIAIFVMDADGKNEKGLTKEDEGMNVLGGGVLLFMARGVEKKKEP